MFHIGTLRITHIAEWYNHSNVNMPMKTTMMAAINVCPYTMFNTPIAPETVSVTHDVAVVIALGIAGTVGSIEKINCTTPKIMSSKN
jgi:uncharacterized protein YggE